VSGFGGLRGARAGVVMEPVLVVEKRDLQNVLVSFIIVKNEICCQLSVFRYCCFSEIVVKPKPRQSIEAKSRRRWLLGSTKGGEH
jgi:hypothetical protein